MNDIDPDEEDGMGFSGLVPSLREKQEDREIDRLRARVRELEEVMPDPVLMRAFAGIMEWLSKPLVTGHRVSIVGLKEHADRIEKVMKK